MVDIDRSGEELGRNAEDEEREEHCEVIYHVKEDEDEDEGGEKHHKDLRRQYVCFRFMSFGSCAAPLHNHQHVVWLYSS